MRIEKPATSLLVAGWLNQDAAARLFREAGQDLSRLTDRAYERGFRAVPLGVQVEATVRSAIERSETHNVLGRFPVEGARPGRSCWSAATMTISASVRRSNGDSIFNGAEDNASGTSAVITAAEAFERSGVRTNRSIVFAGFAAEESGLLGSEALVTRPPFPLRDVVAILNMDVMNLYGRTTDIGALGTDQSTLGVTFAQAARAERLRLTHRPRCPEARVLSSVPTIFRLPAPECLGSRLSQA